MATHRARARSHPQATASSPASNAAKQPRQPAQPTSKEPTSTPAQMFAAEALGTMLLVLFHGGALTALRMMQHTADPPPSVLGLVFTALVDGFSLFVIIMIVGKISGVLINPAVTLGLAIRGRFPWHEVPPYLAAQFTGAIIGALIVLVSMGHDALTVGHLGAVHLATGVGSWQGLLVEALGAFMLVLTINATAEDPRAPSGWAAFTIGMALTAIVLLFGSFTGAPVNPARAFGPNLVDALSGVPVDWGSYLFCYLLGPVLGASAATFLYRFIARPPQQKPAPEPD